MIYNPYFPCCKITSVWIDLISKTVKLHPNSLPEEHRVQGVYEREKCSELYKNFIYKEVNDILKSYQRSLKFTDRKYSKSERYQQSDYSSKYFKRYGGKVST